MMFTTLKAKVLAGTMIAGAALMLATPAAQAQRVVFGVRIGAPVYVAPAAPVYVAPPVVFTGPGYYGGVYYRDYNAWRAHYYWNHRHFDRRFR